MKNVDKEVLSQHIKQKFAKECRGDFFVFLDVIKKGMRDLEFDDLEDSYNSDTFIKSMQAVFTEPNVNLEKSKLNEDVMLCILLQAFIFDTGRHIIIIDSQESSRNLRSRFLTILSALPEFLITPIKFVLQINNRDRLVNSLAQNEISFVSKMPNSLRGCSADFVWFNGDDITNTIFRDSGIALSRSRHGIVNNKNGNLFFNKFIITGKVTDTMHDGIVKANAFKKMEVLANMNIEEEQGHIYADQILCELLKKLGCEDIVAEYNKINKFYS